ncbi:MAG: hydrolase 1, exosortase A system-associated [Rubrivivax sp.]|nr:hydrolase 1, exosortase A system-associated [Rubrivivax sp.]
MSTHEFGLAFECHGDRLAGVVSMPDGPAQPLGVVIVVGGPQYRAGSHRQFVQLARAVADAGFPVLRFDVRGMGDSEGAPRTFMELDDDIGAATDALLARIANLHAVVLVGLCDGASASLMFADKHRADPRIAGLCLLNPWVRSAQTLAQAHVKHYYFQRLCQGEFWRKLGRGQVGAGALTELARSVLRSITPNGRSEAKDAGTFQQRMARGWASFAAPILLLLSEHDLTARELVQAWRSAPEWRDARRHPATTWVDVAGADHTLSSAQPRLVAERQVVEWLRSTGSLPVLSGAGRDR